MNENKPSIKTDWIDEDDAPELTDAFFEQADEYKNGVLIKRGHSSKAAIKTAIKLRLDLDIIAAFKATGDDWQVRMNDVLRKWVDTHSLQ